MKKLVRQYLDEGALVYSDSHGAGIVMRIFRIRKSQPKMLSILFGTSGEINMYESEVKVVQRVERSDNGSISITFDHKHAQLSPTSPDTV